MEERIQPPITKKTSILVLLLILLIIIIIIIITPAILILTGILRQIRQITITSNNSSRNSNILISILIIFLYILLLLIILTHRMRLRIFSLLSTNRRTVIQIHRAKNECAQFVHFIITFIHCNRTFHSLFTFTLLLLLVFTLRLFHHHQRGLNILHQTLTELAHAVTESANGNHNEVVHQRTETTRSKGLVGGRTDRRIFRGERTRNIFLHTQHTKNKNNKNDKNDKNNNKNDDDDEKEKIYVRIKVRVVSASIARPFSRVTFSFQDSWAMKRAMTNTRAGITYKR